MVWTNVVQRLSIWEKIVAFLSVLSSLVTIGVFIHGSILERPHAARITEGIQNRELQTRGSSLGPSKPGGRSRQPVASEIKVLEQKDSTSELSQKKEFNLPARNFAEAKTYRLHSNEVLSLVECHARAEAGFHRLYDVGYAVITIIPPGGTPISQTIMGAGAGIRFKCQDHIEAVLSIVNFDEEQEFVDVALSTN